MNGYIKYFKNGGKPPLDKYNEIWDRVKEKLNIKFHSEFIYIKKR